MQVIDVDVMLCPDCACYAANGDVSGIYSDERVEDVIAAVDAFSTHLCLGDSGRDEEDTMRRCDACRGSAGSLVHFVILGEEY